MVPGDRSHASYIYDRLLTASPAELPVIWGILREHDQEAPQRLWKLLEDQSSDAKKRFRAACVLASTDSAGSDQRWELVATFIADHFLTAVIKNPGDYAALIESLRPQCAALLRPLALTFQDPARADSERSLATSILADYAADDPGRLADLLMSADQKQYAALFPVAQKAAAQVLPVFQAELEKRATPHWADAPHDPGWAQSDPSWKGRFESAHGFLDDQFAFCQTMPLDEFLVLAEALRKSGYRPVRFRPYADGSAILVAAAWTRDGRTWRMASGLTREENLERDEKNRAEKYLPVDVAGYVSPGADGKPADRFAAIWIESNQPGEDARLQAGLTAVELKSAQTRLKDAGMAPVTVQATRAADGSSRYCGTWRKVAASEAPAPLLELDEGGFAGELAANAWSTLIDIAVMPAAASPVTTGERATASLNEAEAAIKAGPNDLNARFARAVANFQLGNHQASLDDLDAVLKKAPQTAMAFQYRALAHARLHHKKEALEDAVAYRNADVPESSKLYLAVVVAAELADGLEEACGKLESALKANPRDSGLHYDAACAYALASATVRAANPAKGQEQAARAIAVLQEAIRIGYSNYAHIQEDADFDSIRGLPAFAEIMKTGRIDRRYAAVWSSDARFEAIPIFGLDPAVHEAHGRKLAAQGFRPVSVSLTRTIPDGPLATASVWHRPVVSEDAKDKLAMRQSRAAVALARFGNPDLVWQLLRHSADPRLRSFIVNWLKPLGADPKLLSAELDRRVVRGPPDPAQGPTGGLQLPGQRSIRGDLRSRAARRPATNTAQRDRGNPLRSRYLDPPGTDPSARHLRHRRIIARRARAPDRQAARRL